MLGLDHLISEGVGGGGFSPLQRLRKREKGRKNDRENRARGGSTFPEISARSPFSSPVLQYIYCSRLLSSRSPLKNPRERGVGRLKIWLVQEFFCPVINKADCISHFKSSASMNYILLWNAARILFFKLHPLPPPKKNNNSKNNNK